MKKMWIPVVAGAMMVSCLLSACNMELDRDKVAEVKQELKAEINKLEDLGRENLMPELAEVHPKESYDYIRACKTVKHVDKSMNVAGIMQEQYAGAMVQVRAGEYMGSGVIYRLDENAFWVLTAKHILEQGITQEPDIPQEPGTILEPGRLSPQDIPQVQVVFCDEYMVACEQVRYSDIADIAFLKINREAFDRETEHFINYSRVRTSKEDYDEMRADDLVVAMGSATGVAENAYEGKLVEPWVFLEDFNQHMMIAKVYAYAGMSGGGLFDQNGNFLGILCGTGEDDHAAFVPLNLIVSEEANLLE